MKESETGCLSDCTHEWHVAVAKAFFGCKCVVPNYAGDGDGDGAKKVASGDGDGDGASGDGDGDGASGTTTILSDGVASSAHSVVPTASFIGASLLSMLI